MIPDQPKLPEFAQQWVNQWKAAAPRLQAIRDQELRQLSAGSQSTQSGDSIPLAYDRYPERNGLVIMQRWFQRQMILDLLSSGRQVNR